MSKRSVGLPPLDDLETVLDAVWAMLERGVLDRHDPFRHPVLATSGPSGPEARTVVLRGAVRRPPVIWCHTDARSAKVGSLRSDPRAAWVFWHPGDAVQVRLATEIDVIANGRLPDEAWAATPPWARRVFLGGDPGTPIADAGAGLPEALRGREPTRLESEAGRPRFAVLAARVREADWLQLVPAGHRRARFTWGGGAHPEGRWVAP